MVASPSTPTRRLTRSQTATTATTVLGKRTPMSRSPSVSSCKSFAMLTPEPTPVSKRVRTTIQDFDGRANKENIPPLRDLLLESPSALRLSRRSSFSSDISAISTISTPSRIGLRRSATHASVPQTPSTAALNNLSLATPPATPPVSIPLYLRVRGLLRATSNSNYGMSMEGRETERVTIESFLHSLDADSNVDESVLYVSGSPGTGKTALVNSVISSKTLFDDVKVIFVNCMAFTSMDALWQKLAEELSSTYVKGRGVGKKMQGKDKVCAILEKQRDLKCILVLDELDNLSVGSANALQPLFALASTYKSSLRIMGIANTHTLASITPLAMDSDSTMSTVASEQGAQVRTIHFSPYGSSELLSILHKRFENLPQDELKNLLPPPVLKLLTMKVSALTGDVRVLFEVLRGAIDSAVSTSSSSSDASSPFDAPPKIIVSPSHVLSALKSHTPSASSAKSKSGVVGAGGTGNSEIVTKVRNLGLQQRLVLLALVLALKRNAATLPLNAHTSFSGQTPSSPSKRSRSPMKRTGSNSSVGAISCDGTSGTDSSQLYSYYSTLLAAADTLKAVSRSEFTELLGVLETTGLIMLSAATTRSLKRSSSFAGPMNAGGAAQLVRLQADIREGEISRGLGVNAEHASDGDALDSELRSIWIREMNRIRREAKAKDTLAMLEGVEGFEDAMED